MRTIIILLALSVITACDSRVDDIATSSNGASEVPINYMQPVSAKDVVSIQWASDDNLNPFSADPLTYEIWQDDKLLDTVDDNSYELQLSQLQNKVGCISIRAVRGAQKSGFSTPSCFIINESRFDDTGV